MTEPSPITWPKPDMEVALPPRFWWTKFIAGLVIVALIALPSLRLWWDWEAQRRLAAIVTDAELRHEPIKLSDFEPARVPDDQNAAILFEQAAAALGNTGQFRNLSWPEESSAKSEIPRALLAANRRALTLAREAQSRPLGSWGLRQSDRERRSFWLPQRYLAQLIAWNALDTHFAENDGDSINCIEDLLHQSRAILGGPRDFLSFRVSAEYSNSAVDVLLRMTPELKIEDGSAFCTSRDALRHLIFQLLDDRFVHDACVLAHFQERDRILELAQDRELFLEECNWLVLPVAQLDAARVIESRSIQSRANMATNLPTARARMRYPDADWYGPRLFLLSRPVTRLAGILSSFPLEGQYELVVTRRAAAVALAIRLYRIDHAGRYPESLEQLVPQYLPFLPADAMAADERPLGYLPSAKPPLLYSVGTDGKDDHGQGDPRRRWDSPDALLPLERLPPPPPRVSRHAQNH